MSPTPERDDESRAAYQAAADRLPVLTRTVFFLHRVDDLSYVEISDRLAISNDAVEGLIGEALITIYRMLEGQTPRRGENAHIAAAEASLRQRYRAHCEDVLRVSGIAAPIAWEDSDDDRRAIRLAIFTAMPPAIRDTFLLNRIDHLNYAQIARRTHSFEWIIRRRMRRAIRYIARAPETFEHWLRDQAARHMRPLR
jgi:DNA-directed RNA polymerase specialized sigma24 family protein